MAKKQNLSAFTIEHKVVVAVIKTEIGVSEIFDPAQDGEYPRVHKINAIWDTGASASVITKNVIDTLGLKKIDDVITYTAAGPKDSEAYLINMVLPNRVAFPAVRVTDGDIAGADALVGMDIISKGDIAITNRLGKTVMTFQVPSSHSFDFVKEINRTRSKRDTKKSRKSNKRR